MFPLLRLSSNTYYLATLQAMKLEVAGEYMLMASQLMLIKSRKLLPTVVEAEPEADDPELELLSQLEEYARFKAASQELAKQHMRYELSIFKTKSRIGLWRCNVESG